MFSYHPDRRPRCEDLPPADCSNVLGEYLKAVCIEVLEDLRRGLVVELGVSVGTPYRIDPTSTVLSHPYYIFHLYIDVPLPKKVSKRVVSRIVLEQDVAADIQLVYEILKSGKLSYLSDSTSHKHIEYECRTIAIQVVDYRNPSAEPEWKLRTLGVDTSVNHSSEVQVEGLKQLLHRLAAIFNSSPLAKRENLKFSPDDFAYRLIGTTGDHAADQKKSHELLRIWRLEVILQRLGEEALFKLEPSQVVVMLFALKAKQIEKIGGHTVWEALPEDEKAGADLLIIREIGQQVFDALPRIEQQNLTRFIRTGCCMHKDLNCVKGGTKSMSDMWKTQSKTPPMLLPAKDNAAVLAGAKDGADPTAVEQRAEEVSKRGGTHATSLGGMIFRNKDKKKGQQDTYDYFMEWIIGKRVPYPDVSNTRYGTHGEAAAIILIYLCIFKALMVHIRIVKDRPGQTNIEHNFATSLEDIPTLTELAVLALYNIAVSRPFMAHVRTHHNVLLFEKFFQTKAAFLSSIIENPTLWTGSQISHNTACLDGQEWDSHSLEVIAAVQKLAPTLPDLDAAVVAFAEGARETFVDRFSDEFKEGSGIDTLTEEERNELFFASTNDANEGGLGSWRRGQGLRPAETLHKFNATFKSTRNDTEAFRSQKLSGEDDELYIIRTARAKDASGLEKKRKMAQMAADEAKAEEHRKKEEKREEKKKLQANVLKDTAQNLVLDDAEIDALKLEALNRQLDYHREAEKKFPMDDSSEKVPLKSHMKNMAERRDILKKAVSRYEARQQDNADTAELLDVTQVMPSGEGISTADHDDDEYMSDFHDDCA